MTQQTKRGKRRLSLVKKGSILLAPVILALAVMIAYAFTDTDGDGMSDEYETFFGLDVNSNDASLNYDGDSLANIDEYAIWTDPYSADTDMDGWGDGADSSAVSRAWIDWGEAFFTSTNDYEYAAPDWWVASYKIGGAWNTNTPPAWYVDATNASGAGSLHIEVDRAKLTNDAVMALEYLDSTNASLYVDLYDATNGIVASNLYGDLLSGTLATNVDYLSIPFQTNANAVGIKIRRQTGEVTVYSSLVYVDLDGDGLDAEQEEQLGTSDEDTDSDSDGLGDYAEEFTHLTDAADPDTDDDGLTDGEEVNTYGSDPLDADSDGDGIDDGDEVFFGNDPASSNTYGTVPFTELFETDTCSAGDIDGQNNWQASPANTALVQTGTVYAGDQALHIDGAVTVTGEVKQLYLSTGEDVIWVDCYTAVRYMEEPGWPQEGSASVYVNEDGRLVVYNGTGASGSWVTLTNHTPLTAGEWVRLTIKVDYSAGEWLICLNGEVIADQIGSAGSRDEFTALMLKGTQGYYDNLKLSTSTPPGISADWDSLPDDWEQTYFGDLDETDSGDPDSDGLTNVEEYNQGTDPSEEDTDADGMSDPEELYWGYSPTNSGSYARIDSGSGTNTWTTGFEAAEGYTNGLLNGQENWTATGAVSVVDTNSCEGYRSARLPSKGEGDVTPYAWRNMGVMVQRLSAGSFEEILGRIR
ncbi:MAG: hypothetical protein R6V03_03655 [Kiritimatiellia bacterium]